MISRLALTFSRVALTISQVALTISRREKGKDPPAGVKTSLKHFRYCPANCKYHMSKGIGLPAIGKDRHAKSNDKRQNIKERVQRVPACPFSEISLRHLKPHLKSV